MKPLSLAYSPCPNDTFIFTPWVEGRVQDAPAVVERFEDIDTLNQIALRGEPDVVKVSFHALGHLRDRYCLLRSGGALGRGCGPLVVAHRTALMRRLAAALDRGRAEHSPGAHCTELMAEGLVGGVFAIAHSHLLRRDPRALASLAPELTQMVLAPYLPEQTRLEPRLQPRTLRSLQLAGGSGS